MSFYEYLGVSKDASERDIKKGYMKAARKYHPDKIPKHEYTDEIKAKFLEIQKAYDILSDPEKRELYDRYGESAFDNNGGGGGGGMSGFETGNFTDMFNNIFGPGGPFGGGGLFSGFGGGGGGGDPRHRRHPKPPPTVHKMHITLEQAFHGITKTLSISAKKKCTVCKGNGCQNPTQNKRNCSECGGRGRKVIRRQVNAIMVQQMEVPCNNCHQKGIVYASGTECKTCKGKCLNDISQMEHVVIPPGVRNMHKMVFENRGNDVIVNPKTGTTLAGDVVVVVVIKDHPIFKQVNESDLYIEKEILLHQSLCGFELTIPYLDGNMVKIPIHDVITPGFVKIVPNMGMPRLDDPSQRGNMLIKFHIKFPQQLSAKNKQVIYQALTAAMG